jgi:hypothetical protein
MQIGQLFLISPSEILIARFRAEPPHPNRLNGRKWANAHALAAHPNPQSAP